MKWRPEMIIEGITVPIPDNFEQTISDLCSSDSKRTLAGQAIKKVVAVKSSFPLKWEKLEWRLAASLVNAVDGKNSIHVKVIDVRNPYYMTEFIIYVNDRVCKPVQFDTDGTVYWSVEFKQIEM